MSDSDTTVQSLKDLVEQFRQERNWVKHHTNKNLAVSIAIEAAELLEHYQWGEYQEGDSQNKVSAELADIIIYCLNFAISNNIDVSQAVADKIEHNARKYPAAVFNANKDDAADYWQIKKDNRQQEWKLSL